MFQGEESVVTPQEPSLAGVLPQGSLVNGGIVPKPQWRGLIPSMASTPDHKGSWIHIYVLMGAISSGLLLNSGF